jgi:hypothetical protein
MEDAQILENKRSQLQKLIEMFAHQSDAFILNHEVTEDLSMSSLGDYSEYDHADNINELGDPGHSKLAHIVPPSRLYVTDSSGVNAQYIPLLLPSSLGWDWCARHGHKSLSMKEATLHYAQATDAIHQICLALGFKSVLF